MEATIDVSRANQAMDSLREAMIGAGEDAKNLVRDETRRLAKMIAAFTPPIKGGAGSPQKVGEAAVERELKNLISEATPGLIEEISSRYGVHDIHTAYVTEKDGTHLNLKWGAIDATGAAIELYHKQNRGPDGKVKREKRPRKDVWSARVVVPFGTRGPYIDKIKARVGRWKATWALIGAKLGDKYPNWISRHFDSISGIATADIDGLNNGEKPFAVFGSAAPGNNRIRQRVQSAVSARARAMARRTKLILSGYSQDISRGMKAQARAKDYSESEEAVE